MDSISILGRTWRHWSALCFLFSTMTTFLPLYSSLPRRFLQCVLKPYRLLKVPETATAHEWARVSGSQPRKWFLIVASCSQRQTAGVSFVYLIYPYFISRSRLMGNCVFARHDDCDSVFRILGPCSVTYAIRNGVRSGGKRRAGRNMLVILRALFHSYVTADCACLRPFCQPDIDVCLCAPPRFASGLRQMLGHYVMMILSSSSRRHRCARFGALPLSLSFIRRENLFDSL